MKNCYDLVIIYPTQDSKVNGLLHARESILSDFDGSEESKEIGDELDVLANSLEKENVTFKRRTSKTILSLIGQISDQKVNKVLRNCIALNK